MDEIKDKVRRQHTRDEIRGFTEIGYLSDGKTVVVYTEDIALYDRLTKWEQCLIAFAYVQQAPGEYCGLGRIGFELYFPKRMMREFRYCGIASTNGTTGRRSCITPLDDVDEPGGLDFSDILWDLLETQRSE